MILALFGEPRAQVQELMSRIDAEADVFGRKPAYNLSFRPIIGATEEEAWRKAGTFWLGWKPLEAVDKAECPKRKPRAD